MAFPYLVINDAINDRKLVVLVAFSETELSFDCVYFLIVALFVSPETVLWHLKEWVIVVGFGWGLDCGGRIVGCVWRGLVGIDFIYAFGRVLLFCQWGGYCFYVARLHSSIPA